MTPPTNPPGLRGWLLLPLMALVCGCGSRIAFAPVEGTVTQNGKPVGKVRVIFFADDGTHGPQVSGLTDEQGHYHLRKDDQQEGAPIGRHRICLLDRSTPPPTLRRIKGGAPFATKPAEPPRIPSEYTTPGSTPLRGEVRSGPQTIDFQLP
jgi:hypothetical protein